MQYEDIVSNKKIYTLFVHPEPHARLKKNYIARKKKPKPSAAWAIAVLKKQKLQTLQNEF